MSNKQDNQALINRTKQYLKEYGYEVKTSHLYEVFAKLVNEPNWHVAKAKNKNLLSLIKNALNPKLIETEDELFKKLDINIFSFNFLYGFDLDDNLIRMSMIDSVFSLFCGNMGSGKTTALKFTIFSHMLKNSENTLYIFNNPYQGVRDFYDLPQNTTKFFIENSGSHYQSNKMIDYLHEEINQRLKLFEENNVSTLDDYHILLNIQKETSLQRLSNVVLTIENLHYYLNQASDSNTETCNKVSHIFKNAKNCGFYIMGELYKRSFESLSNDTKDLFRKNGNIINCENNNNNFTLLFQDKYSSSAPIKLRVPLLYNKELKDIKPCSKNFATNDLIDKLKSISK